MTLRPRCLASTLLLLAAACGGSSGGSTPAGPVTYSQSDLAGSWDRIILFSNDTPGWYQQVLSVDAGGAVTSVSCRNQTGAVACATGPIALVIDAAGVVTQGGGGGNLTFRGVLSRSKGLIAGTATSGLNSNLQVFRKRPSGVTFTQADLAGPFAYQVLHTGSDLRWERGAGTISPVGTVTVTSTVDSTGNTTLPPNPADTVTVAADGTISLTGGGGGFISPDKQTAFFVDGASGGPASLFAILKTGGSFTQADLTGPWEFNVLNSGATQAASPWTRGTATFDAGGVATFTGASTPSGATALTSFSVAVGPGGVMTRPDNAAFGGQLSLGKELYVRTQTSGGGISFGLSLRR